MRQTQITQMRFLRPAPAAVMPAIFVVLLLSTLAFRASVAADMQPATPDSVATVSGDSRVWTAGMRLQLFSSDATHAAIEQGMGVFQEYADLSGPLYIVLAFEFGSGHNLGEMEGAWGEIEVPFLDDEHFFEVNEFYAMMWYRRLLPLTSRIQFLPGAAAGYTWPYAKIFASDSSVDGGDSAVNENTKILSGSGVTFAIGAELEIGLLYDTEGGLYLNFDYRYRFGPGITANTTNDGEIFFPGGSEFDHKGSYVGVGLTLRAKMRFSRLSTVLR